MSFDKPEEKSKVGSFFKNLQEQRWEQELRGAIEHGDPEPIRKKLIKKNAKKEYAPLEANKFKKVPDLLQYALNRRDRAKDPHEYIYIQRILFYIECCCILTDSTKLTKDIIEQIYKPIYLSDKPAQPARPTKPAQPPTLRIGQIDESNPLDQAIKDNYIKLVPDDELQRLFKEYSACGINSKYILQENKKYKSEDRFDEFSTWQEAGSPNHLTEIQFQKEQSLALDKKEITFIELSPEQKVKQPKPEKPQPTESKMQQFESAKKIYVAAIKGDWQRVDTLINQAHPHAENVLNTGWHSQSRTYGTLTKHVLSPIVGAALCTDPEARYHMLHSMVKAGARPNVTSPLTDNENVIIYSIGPADKNGKYNFYDEQSIHLVSTFHENRKKQKTIPPSSSTSSGSSSALSSSSSISSSSSGASSNSSSTSSSSSGASSSSSGTLSSSSSTSSDSFSSSSPSSIYPSSVKTEHLNDAGLLTIVYVKKPPSPLLNKSSFFAKESPREDLITNNSLENPDKNPELQKTTATHEPAPAPVPNQTTLGVRY